MSAEDELNVGAAIALQAGEATGNPWVVGIAAAWLIGDYLWNYFNRADLPPPTNTKINLPTVTAGTVMPLVYGWVNIDTPALVWIGQVNLYQQPDGTYFYGLNCIFVAGVGFIRSNVRFMGVTYGGVPAKIFSNPADQRGNGGFETLIHVGLRTGLAGDPGNTGHTGIEHYMQVLNGRPDQISEIGGFAQNWLADMLNIEGVTAAHAQSYRNYISVVVRWHDGSQSAVWGDDPNFPAIGFSFVIKPQVTILNEAVDDSQLGCNPIDVLYDIITGTFNKLAQSTSRVSLSEFRAAAVICEVEGLLFSRKWNQATDAGTLVAEIAAFVNGIVYEDPTDQLIHIKLLRADYDPTALRTIDTSNCVELQNVQLTTWDDVPNKVTVSYTDPSTWGSNTVSTDSQATAVGQDGIVNEVVLNYPGCTNRDQAYNMALREMSIRSRPIIKCIAITTREFADLKPGDCVYVNWPKANISGIVFRVLNLTTGVLKNGRVSVTLVQDVFYVHKKHPPVPPPTGTTLQISF